jgi:8-oxo-dGTP pyrophosphatase MutT (NUDIX family)
MELQVGVKIILQNKDGKFLLLHKNPANYPKIKVNELLDIPGGRINPGVPLFENLKREVFEETKLNLEKEPKLIYAQDILRPTMHVVRLTYLGEIEGTPVLDHEHTEYRWLSKDEVLAQPDLDPFSREAFSKLI